MANHPNRSKNADASPEEIAFALKFMREMRAMALDENVDADMIGLRVRYDLAARDLIAREQERAAAQLAQ